jgi:hypothetical protein
MTEQHKTTKARPPRISTTRDGEIAAVWLLSGGRRLDVVCAPDGGIAWAATEGARMVSGGQFDP